MASLIRANIKKANVIIANVLRTNELLQTYFGEIIMLNVIISDESNPNKLYKVQFTMYIYRSDLNHGILYFLQHLLIDNISRRLSYIEGDRGK